MAAGNVSQVRDAGCGTSRQVECAADIESGLDT
jgi:hypothetical protein